MVRLVRRVARRRPVWRGVAGRVERMADWRDWTLGEARLLRGQACAIPEWELGRTEVGGVLGVLIGWLVVVG